MFAMADFFFGKILNKTSSCFGRSFGFFQIFLPRLDFLINHNKITVLIFSRFLFVMSAVCVTANAFSQFNKQNFAVIDSADSPADIIRKAINVVPSERQLNWQKLELTAFLHFGMNTFTDREWGDGKESPALFNPAKLDAMQWVRTLKNAGFRQIIITAKHHDGFCLWPSAYTGHSVKNSPWKNGNGDVVRAVSDACHRLGVGFGVYLSPWDRNSPLYGTGKAYDDYFMKQLTELLTLYGQVDEVWFDGANGEGPNGKKQVYDFPAYIALIRKLQPQAVIFGLGPDVRWVGTETGYGRNTEWSVVPTAQLNTDSITANSQTEAAFQPIGDMTGDDLGSRDKLMHAKGLVWYPAETDVSIRPGWFYHSSQDSLVKSPEKLLDIYVHSVGKNGVLLLNVPPNRDGLISNADIKSLNGFRTLLDATFKNNILKNAEVFSSAAVNVEGIMDNNLATYATSQNADTTLTILLTLPKSQTFNMILLQENIANGQKIEAWKLEIHDGTGWQEVVSGTTVGYKRIEKFAAVAASELRFQITAARSNPELSTLRLYDSETGSKTK